MTANQRKGALNEIFSLRIHAEKMGVTVESLIEIPLRIRLALEAFCAAYPDECGPVQDAVDVRDFMLEAYRAALPV